MIEMFIEFVLVGFLVWLAIGVTYWIYGWYNSSRQVIRRKLLETSD